MRPENKLLTSRKSVTIEDVARVAGVAISTASAALNDKYGVSAKTREAVRLAAEEIGFEPNLYAQRLITGRCNDTIYLFALYLDRSVVTQKLQMVQGLLSAQGYQAPIYAYGDNLAEETINQSGLFNSLRRQRPLAIACHVSGLHEGAIEELKRYTREGGHVVAYDLEVDMECDQVWFDREENTYRAAKHLLEQGHQRIGLYCSGTRTHPRYIGFERALNEFGLEVAPEWLFHGGYYEQGGTLLADKFLSLRERPTAMCIVNDYTAAAFIARIQRRGLRVPDDVSVIGQDDMPVAEHSCAVPLTTVSQPTSAIAEKVVEFLLDRIEGKYTGEPRRALLYGELVERESVAPV